MDLFVANIDREMFRSTATIMTRRLMTWPAAPALAMATRWMSGWGLKFFDYDNDGNLDLFLANGIPTT